MFAIAHDLSLNSEFSLILNARVLFTGPERAAEPSKIYDGDPNQVYNVSLSEPFEVR